MSRKFFNKVFSQSLWDKRFFFIHFNKVEHSLIMKINAIEFWESKFSNKIFDRLEDLGFIKTWTKNEITCTLKIKEEYLPSIENMLDLISSEITANNELGYILFKNIQEYALHPLQNT